MIKLTTLISIFFLSSCVMINTRKYEDKPTTISETPEQIKNREARAKQDRDLQRNSLGYFKERRALSKSSMGSPDGFLAVGNEEDEYSHRFFIKTVCGDSSQFTTQPLRYTNFTWMLSDTLKGSAQSDHEGVIEFTATTPTSIDFTQVSITFKGQNFVVKTGPANMILSIPQNLCKTK